MAWCNAAPRIAADSRRKGRLQPATPPASSHFECVTWPGRGRNASPSATVARTESQRQEQECRRILERLLHHHEGRPPDQRDECKRQIGAPGSRKDGRDKLSIISALSEQQGEGEQDPSQAQIAAIGMVPLPVVWPPPPCPPADRDGRNAQREGDVGVGRGQVQPRAYAQMRVHRAQEPAAERLPEAGRPPRADLPDLRGQLGAVGRRFSISKRRSAAWANVAAMASMVAISSERKVDLRARHGRNRVDADAAFQRAEVEGRTRRSGLGRRHVALFGEPGDGLAQRVDRLGFAVIGSNCGRPAP